IIDTDITDEERSFKLDHSIAVSDFVQLGFGTFIQRKDRDTRIGTQRNRFNAADTTDWSQFVRNPNELRTPWNAIAPAAGGYNKVAEDRNDYYVALNGDADSFAWEAGLRYETTDMSIADFTENTQNHNDYEFLLPSAHIRFDLTAVDRFTASV